MLKITLLILALMLSNNPRAQGTPIPRFIELATLERGNDFAIAGQLPERVAFSPDGKYLAAGVRGAVNIWDLTTGEIVRKLPHESFAVSWSPDGRWLTTGDMSVDGTLRLWDAVTGELAGEFDQGASDAGIYSSWSPDSHHFVVDSGQIIDPETGEIVMQLGRAWAIPMGVHWSPDGTRIAITTDWTGSYMHIWSAQDGTLLDTYWSDRWAAWSPDGSRIASTGQVRDLSTGLPLTIAPELYGDLAWSPDGQWLVSSGFWGYYAGSTLYIWDPESGALLTMLETPGCSIRGIAWSTDGSRFAASCFYGADADYRSHIRVWSVEKGGLPLVRLPSDEGRWNQRSEPPPALASPNRLHVAIDTGTAVEIYELATGTLVEALDGYALGERLWSADSLRLLVLQRGADPRLGPRRIWTLGAGLSAPIYNATDGIWWSLDGAQMAVVSDTSTLRFYDSATGSLLDTVRGYPLGETRLNPVSAGKYIVTTHGSYAGGYPSPTFAVFNTELHQIVAMGFIGLGFFRIEGDTLYWDEVQGALTEYDLTGQTDPIVHQR